MDRLVAIAVSRRYLMVGLFAAVIVGGLIAFKQLNIEAYPDPTPPMVDIVTQSPGLSSEEIERYITIPIETQVSGIKNLRTIRTISLYGLSDVKLQFSFDYTYDGCRNCRLCLATCSQRFHRSAPSAKSTATGWPGRQITACST